MHRSTSSCILDSEGPNVPKPHEKQQERRRPVFEAYPVELRPVLTKHRLRRRRHRNAASVLTGAALALGVSALRPVPASAATPIHTASYNSTRPTPNHPAPTPKMLTPPNRPIHHTPRHAAPAPKSPHPSTPHSPTGGPATNESRPAPPQPARHARSPGPPTGHTLSIHLDNPPTGHTALPPPYP
jgi:hypothetical protein